MTQHTPGPWKIEQDESGKYNIETDYKNGLNGVLISVGLYGTGGIYETDNGRSKANARLIAAAPELLEVLERIMDYATTGASVRDVNIYEQPEFVNAYAAIKKAKGGEK